MFVLKSSLLVLSLALGNALKVGPSVARRVVVAKAAACGTTLIPFAIFAEDLEAELYKRADEGTLNAARAIERAEKDELAEGLGATCAELDALIAVDREAISFEKEKLAAISEAQDARETTAKAGTRRAEAKKKADIKNTANKLQLQVDRLKAVRKNKGCASANLQQGSDFDVYKRADEGQLTYPSISLTWTGVSVLIVPSLTHTVDRAARVIERAKKGELVNGSGASCKELERIIAVDKKAVKFERDTLDALGSSADPKTKASVQEAEDAISKQIQKLESLKSNKSC